jgi:hypothetical protein
MNLFKKIINFFKERRERKIQRRIDATVTDGLGHNHEWEEHREEGKVFCWICGDEKEI